MGQEFGKGLPGQFSLGSVMWLKADVSESCNHLKATWAGYPRWPFIGLPVDTDCQKEAQLRLHCDTYMWPKGVAT